MVRSLGCLLAIAGIALFHGSCRLFFAAKEIKQLDSFSTVAGQVRSPNQRSEPIVVCVFRENGDQPILRSYSVLLQAGAFKILLEPGRYEIWAFEDLDQDFVLDDGEPIGSPRPYAMLEVGAGVELTADIDLSVGGARPDWLSIDLSSAESTEHLDVSLTTIGEIASFDDRRFAASRGTYGSWRPVSTIRKRGLGVFFMEPYDPCRIPVLFIHGMGGSPSEFRALSNALDRRKFQPWFFTYPSSLRLGLLSDYLANAIRTLGVRHKPDQLFVVAHSMGGLVARGFINDNVAEKKKALIQTFISLSTPWNGHKSAESGLDFSPVVIPSWIDMVPNSAFIATLYRSPLPPYVKHHLWFGFVEDEPGDEVISTASMLDMRAQDGAADVRGFAANHREILVDPAVIERFQSVLRQAASDGPTSRRCSKHTTLKDS